MKLLKHTLLFLLVFLVSSTFAQNLTQKDTLTDIVVEKLSVDINSRFDEIMPVLSNDGKQLYFTRVGSDKYVRSLYFQGKDLFWDMSYNHYLRSLRKTYEMISGKQISDPIHSRYNQDIWVADLGENGTIGKVKNLPFPANNALPNSLCSTTPNPDAFIVMNQFFPKGGMQGGFSIISKEPDGKNWSFPKPIEIEGFNATGQEINLTLNEDGTIMLISMYRPDSRGYQDLYVSFFKPSGKWSHPINLGKQVNSTWKETSPFLAADNKTLFFASNRRDIYNGSNIYSTVRLDDTWQNWAKPTILVKPVNSHFDESQPVFNFETGMLFFASNRSGQSDIYKVKIDHPTVDLTTSPKEYVALEGRVVDNNGWLVPGAKIMYRTYSYQKYKEATIAEDGTFAIRVPKGKKIHIIAQKKDFDGQVKHLFYRSDYLYFKAQYTTLHVTKKTEKEVLAQANSTPPTETAKETTIPIVREKAKTTKSTSKEQTTRKRKGHKIELKPIFFARSKDRILRKSYSELNRLIRLLKKHPKMHIRVEGHTDANGKSEDLIKLSSARALAIKAYLVNRNIQANRIKTIGFGGQFPVTDNDTERSRRKNRRVEIYVTNKVEGIEFSNNKKKR